MGALFPFLPNSPLLCRSPQLTHTIPRGGPPSGWEMSSSVGGGGVGGAALAGGDVASLLEKAKELDQMRKEQDDVATEINKIHKKIISSPEMADKSVDAILARLRGLYVQAKELSESEVSASNALVALLDGVLQSGVSAAPRKKIEVGEQKKKRMKSDTDTPRFSSASMRSQLDQAANLKGEQVAAKVKSDDEKDEWFVVKVIHFDKETKEFEVLDEEPGDDEESAQKFERFKLQTIIPLYFSCSIRADKVIFGLFEMFSDIQLRKYKLPMSYIIPFPKKGDPSSAQDFGQGRQVLAVYPGTTALYRATVASHRKRKSDDYHLLFDDDEEDGSLPERAVPFYRVVALPEGHRQ